jgi:ornithine carbamoyltransferase
MMKYELSGPPLTTRGDAVPHLISIDDLTDADLTSIVARGRQLRRSAGRPEQRLDGVIVGTYFRQPSTRTRTAFSSGALRLGARLVPFGPDDLQTNTGETVADTGRVLSRMLDVLVARTTGTQSELRSLAAQERMSVVNAMSTTEHPTQALADLTTMLCRFERIEGLRILYVGEGNSTAAALALALTRFEGVRLELRTPAGYGLAAGIRARAESQAAAHSATLVERHDMSDPAGGCDVIYATRWQTTGSTRSDPGWRERFRPFQVHIGLWGPSPAAVFMHDLPAHRGEEVTGEVLDGPASIVFDQAGNKMYSAMAVLEWCRHGVTESAGDAVATYSGVR